MRFAAGPGRLHAGRRDRVPLAIDHPHDLSRLVLDDALGLNDFEPAPDFGDALRAFQAAPTQRTHDLLWRRCMRDLDRVRERMCERWEPFEAYNLELARTPSVQAAGSALMQQFGIPAIPVAELERIAVPTTLI